MSCTKARSPSRCAPTADACVRSVTRLCLPRSSFPATRSKAPPRLASIHERLVDDLHHVNGPHAVTLAMEFFVAAQAADRIADHAAIIGARLRYLLTGEPAHLAAEVR